MKQIPFQTLQQLILLISVSVMMPAQANQFVVDLSYQYETGDYSEQTSTDVTTVPLKLKYYANVWSFAAELSYLSVTGVETVIPGTNGQSMGHGQGSGAGSSPASASSSLTRSGLGDTRLSLSRAFFPQQKDGLFYEITVTAKIATANEDEFLGTGENDYAIKLALSSTLGPWMPGLTLGYQLTGDTPDTDFNDIVFVSAGAGYRLDQYSTLGLGYDFQQAVSDGVEDFAAISVNYSRELSNGSSISFAIKSGLTSNSLDRGFSLSASLPF